MTRAILPHIGYQQRGSMDIYARVLRPWRQVIGFPPKNWKFPFRLVRNTVWSLSATAPTAAWKSVPIGRFEDSHAALIPRVGANMSISSKRSVSLLNYILDCPLEEHRAYLLQEGDRNKGYFLISVIGGQARITDISLNSSDEGDWAAAYSLAVEEALRFPDACAVVCACSNDRTANALKRNGFRSRKTEPIYVLDPKGALAKDSTLELSLMDGDAFYLHNKARPFLT